MAGYGDDAGFTSWLASQGYTLPAGAPVPAVLRQRGSDYIDAAYEPRLFCSARTGGFDQERAWPRTGHVVGGVDVVGIPQVWVFASYRAAWLEAYTPGWASGSINPSRLTKREKAGDVEREFFDPGADGGNLDAIIGGMISGLFCPVVSNYGLGIWAIVG